MSVSVNAPKTPVTKGSTGIATATLPNICKMPGPPAPFVPAPLPNIGKSGDSAKGYSKKVKIEGNTVAIKGASFKSMGDMASKGTGGGLISANTHGPCKFIGPGAIDVKFEGKNVQLLTDPMTNNGGGSGSPPNSATLMGIVQISGMVITVPEFEICPICLQKNHELKEDPETEGSATDLYNAFKTEVENATATGKMKGAKIQTMLGVAKCKNCGNKYANQSGPASKELCDAAGSLGMKHFDEAFTYKKKSGKSLIEDSMNGVREKLRDLLKDNPIIFESTWEKCEDATNRSLDGGKTSYPPGSCAAQGALVLLLDYGGLPENMTEKFYSKTGEKMKTGITYFDENLGRENIKEFGLKDGEPESVPPCGSCELILPLLICNNEDTCSDGS